MLPVVPKPPAPESLDSLPVPEFLDTEYRVSAISSVPGGRAASVSAFKLPLKVINTFSIKLFHTYCWAMKLFIVSSNPGFSLSLLEDLWGEFF